jgi:hypothetical protein
MLIRDIFETKVEEKIEPVIKVGEQQDEKKLASEIGSYVVTPTIEKYMDDFLDHYTDTFLKQTTEIGVWISGYFGSGKSHFAKVISLLVENRNLDSVWAAKRFESRVPVQAPGRSSILRSLSLVSQCESKVLAFNLNTLADSKQTPLPRLLLSQYYQSKGYGANLLYAHVIEAELDKRGKLLELHAAAEKLAKKPWAQIQQNLGFYSKHLYQAACEVAPDAFASPEQVAQALTTAEKGGLYNVHFLVQTILDDLAAHQKAVGKPCRLVLVMDESGQWIEDDAGRLAQLQALVEEASIKGQGKIWIFVTTHGDMGSIYQNAKALRGDMKKIEGRFRFKFPLTTENIELVLRDRIFKKNLKGKAETEAIYSENPGVLRDLGELKNTSQNLPQCDEEHFSVFYPFFPYQVHLIPEIVKSLRSAGGRGEQLSGSTRTLLAITQDILRVGRRKYLDSHVGEMVSFDEVYHNLQGEGEVTPDVRRELSRVEQSVPGADAFTRRIAEVIFLIREMGYIPRSIDNIARLMVEKTSDDLQSLTSRIKPELDKLIKAKMVARMGEEYEFLTGERRTFEEEVSEEAAGIKWQDLQSGLLKEFATTNVLGFETIPCKGNDFQARILFDGAAVTKEGFVNIRIHSPLAALSGTKITELEDQSLRPEEKQSLFVLSDRIPGFDEELKRYLAMRSVVDRWKGDPHKSQDALRLATERESQDLEKLRRKVLEGIRDGIKNAHIVFLGASRTVTPKPGQTPGDTLRAELAAFWPTLYPKYEKVPVRIINEAKGILDVLKGSKDLTSDVKELKLTDKAGQIDPSCPLLDSIRMFLSTRQSKKERTLGKDLLTEFEKPPYGWDPGAIRVGVAAFVRSGAVKIVIGKKPFTNPADGELQDVLRNSRAFDKAELVLEETELSPDVLTAVRTNLIALTGIRKIDETPAALADAFGAFGKEVLEQAIMAELWAEPAGLPLPPKFHDGKETLSAVMALTNPMHRVAAIDVQKDNLESFTAAIRQASQFVEKHGKTFTAARDFAKSLSSIEHLLPTNGTCESFHKNWATAQGSATFTTESTWKELQNGKTTAATELEKLIIDWRNEARNVADIALQRLPEILAASKLPKDMLDPIAEPLKKFISDLDKETDVVRVSQLPGRAKQIVRLVEDLVRKEQDKRRPKEPRKPVARIEVSKIVTTVRIENEEQWNLVRDHLDSAVKEELKKGNEVELQ